MSRMIRRASSTPYAGQPGVSLVTRGRGVIVAVGAKPVSVTYELILRRADEQLSGHGLVHARYTDLEAMWLQPIVMLRLEDGQYIDISITEIENKQGKFEVTQDL